MTTPLPCGCQRGFYLCQQAGALWDEVGARYSEWRANTATLQRSDEEAWARYEQARADYDAHFLREER